MKNYKVKSIVESILAETNQKVIIVDIIDPPEPIKEGKINFQMMKYLMKNGGDFNLIFDKRLIIDFNSEYAKEIQAQFNNDKIFNLDVTQFLGIDQKINNKTITIYFHNSVNTSHLVEEVLPFFSVKFNKLNNNINLGFKENISPASIDIAFRDIFTYLKYSIKNIEVFEQLSNGSLEISVAKFKRELTADEKYKSDLRLFPRHEVLLINRGFTFKEILVALSEFKEMLPHEIKAKFMYDIDFKSLLNNHQV
jgi:hypothetical protein